MSWRYHTLPELDLLVQPGPQVSLLPRDRIQKHEFQMLRLVAYTTVQLFDVFLPTFSLEENMSIHEISIFKR